MPTAGVCYTASSGYVFQTVVSALQARQHVDPSVGVYIVLFGAEDEHETAVFRPICEAADITLLSAPASVLGDLPPNYARLFLDLVLPDDVDEILYLDGDTQILGDIDPLVRAEVPTDGILAVRDPMVFIREVNRRQGSRIDEWWNDSSIPEHIRGDYINSGVLRVSRSTLTQLRERCLAIAANGELKFSDQDAINIAVDGRIGTLSMSWNYPGFLIGTHIGELLPPPRIVHFMSNPRPWNAPFRPWGQAYFAPYEQLVAEHPEVAPYWNRFAGLRRYRYDLQQLWKRAVEGRHYESVEAARTVLQLHSRDLTL